MLSYLGSLLRRIRARRIIEPDLAPPGDGAVMRQALMLKRLSRPEEFAAARDPR